MTAVRALYDSRRAAVPGAAASASLPWCGCGCLAAAAAPSGVGTSGRPLPLCRRATDGASSGVCGPDA